MGTLKIFNKRFYYYFIILVIVIFSFYILSIVLGIIEKFVITSMVAQVVSTASSIKVRIPPYLYDIILVCQQDVVNAGQSISANITVTNNGLYEGDVQIEWWIEDIHGTNYTSGSTVVNISYGESWVSTKSLLVPSYVSAGIYYYKVRVIAETYSNTAYDTFEVQRPTATTISAPPSGGGVGVEVPEKKANVDVIYKKYFTIVAGIPKEYKIKIKNSGDLVLHNLSLYLQGLELSWYLIEPDRVELEINKSVIFNINFTVPASAQIKKYPVNILIKSEELDKSIYLSLNVIEILEKTEFEKLRESLEKEIRDIEEELQGLQERGIPIDPLYRLLYNAKEKLELARSEMEAGNLSEASILINEVKFIIDVIKETISEIKPITMRAFWPVWLVIIIIMMSFIVFLIISRKRKKKRGKMTVAQFKTLLKHAKEKLELADIEIERKNLSRAKELLKEYEILVNTIKKAIIKKRNK